MTAHPPGPSRSVGYFTAALVVMPFLQLLPLDFDRTGALLLLAPGLWVVRNELAAAVTGLLDRRIPERWMVLTGVGAVMLATALARHPAPALALTAAWVLLAGSGLAAGRLASGTPAISRRLLGAIALSGAIGVLAVWMLWLLTARGAMPLYAHHRHLGLHLLTSVIASTALLVLHRSHPRKRLLWLALTSLTWGGLLWSGGRMPVLAALGGLTGWFVSRPSERRPLFWATVLPLVAGLGLSALFWTDRAELGWWHALARTTAVSTPVAAGSDYPAGFASQLTSTRTVFWLEAARHAVASPWLGHGPDAYRFLLPKLDGQQPHNLMLQLWLDVGLLGALPLLALLFRWLVGGWRRARQAHSGELLPAWLALLGACVLGGMIDGVFYHLLSFLPAVLALGVVIDACSQRETVAVPSRTTRRVVFALAAVAATVLTLHSWLFYRLNLTEAPSPTSVAARTVRAFPSTTFGLWLWLEKWEQQDPATTLEWTRWAQAHSPNPTLFHLRAAQQLLAAGDRSAARAELLAARAKTHWTNRAAIDAMLARLPPPDR